MDAQADLSLRWAHRSFCWFCHAACHFDGVLATLCHCIYLEVTVRFQVLHVHVFDDLCQSHVYMYTSRLEVVFIFFSPELFSVQMYKISLLPRAMKYDLLNMITLAVKLKLKFDDF